ncbi:RHS repeat-associated core domain-containing protein [Thorsellia anophelis DSM 18579]|uniref:RHS repeat-associated core domain-containing protein n=1 Tax=Thorsellia anophelis DSM 18579 TaxID=1123402 RepID=A0A1I0FM84_9GAMM|nr:RHS repeat-associated core domain-containing protein [Thorsellia anophelis]SET59347.1 RHS repeat-associated core domain-containing protein [Thorsellia anophelis DSM 18579]
MTTAPKKIRVNFTPQQKNEFAKLIVEDRFIRGDKNHLLAEYSRDKLHCEITRSQGALNLETQYDATGRITRHSLRKTSQSVAFQPLRENRYEYNDVNELISRHILNGDEKSPLTFAKSLSEYFEYDTNGQVLVHSPALEMKYLQEEHYKYDAAGNLITDDFHPPHWTNQTTRHKGQTYHYDGFGRLVQIKRQENVVKQFEYDEHHRMIQSVVKQGNDEWVAQYEYDALSRRISKTSQYYTDVYDHHRTLVEYKSKKQLFYWQGLRLAGESEASHTENRRWYAYEENSYAPLALIDHWHEIDKDEVVYYHNQLNGSPYALSNTQGELICETETYLWGSYRRPAKNQVTLLYGQPLRFQGQYFDQETGLHYNTFRYYDPETGRFTQQDPIGLAGGINLYQYAPNPLMWIDPLGLSCTAKMQPYREDVRVKGPHADIYVNNRKVAEARLGDDGKWYRWGDLTKDPKALKEADKVINGMSKDAKIMTEARSQTKQAIADFEQILTHGNPNSGSYQQAQRGIERFKKILEAIR